MGDLPGPFLTDLDSRARVKGSRDPLGAQSIWTRFGRHVIGNLTTVSNSLRDFTVLLLGYYFAERVAAEEGPGSELATFLKWEQLAAFARASLNNDYAFRGTERVRAILKGGTRISQSNARAHQILSNQQIYGIWGLYSVPGAASGLVTQDPPRLTPPGLEFVERSYLPAFKEAGMPNANRLVDLLRRSEIRIDTNAFPARCGRMLTDLRSAPASHACTLPSETPEMAADERPRTSRPRSTQKAFVWTTAGRSFPTCRY